MLGGLDAGDFNKTSLPAFVFLLFALLCLVVWLTEGYLVVVVLGEPSIGRTLLALRVEAEVCFSLQRSMGCVVLLVCVCDALTYLLDSVYVQFGAWLWGQVVGIPVGACCAPCSIYCNYPNHYTVNNNSKKQQQQQQKIQINKHKNVVIHTITYSSEQLFAQFCSSAVCVVQIFQQYS